MKIFLIMREKRSRVGSMSKTLREVIKEITRRHLVDAEGLAMGQC